MFSCGLRHMISQTLSQVVFVAFSFFSPTQSIIRLTIFFSFSPLYKLSIFVRQRKKLSLSFCSRQLLKSSLSFIPSSIMPVIAAGRKSFTFRSQMHIKNTCHTSITQFVFINCHLASFTLIFPIRSVIFS